MVARDGDGIDSPVETAGFSVSSVVGVGSASFSLAESVLETIGSVASSSLSAGSSESLGAFSPLACSASAAFLAAFLLAELPEVPEVYEDLFVPDDPWEGDELWPEDVEVQLVHCAETSEPVNPAK